MSNQHTFTSSASSFSDIQHTWRPSFPELRPPLLSEAGFWAIRRLQSLNFQFNFIFKFQSYFGSRCSSREITKCQDWISKSNVSSLLRWRGLVRTGNIGRKLLRRTRFFSPTEKCGATKLGQLWQPKEQTSSFLRARARTSWDCLGTLNQDGV